MNMFMTFGGKMSTNSQALFQKLLSVANGQRLRHAKRRDIWLNYALQTGWVSTKDAACARPICELNHEELRKREPKCPLQEWEELGLIEIQPGAANCPVKELRCRPSFVPSSDPVGDVLRAQMPLERAWHQVVHPPVGGGHV
jgi:hypothetical protein